MPASGLDSCAHLHPFPGEKSPTTLLCFRVSGFTHIEILSNSDRESYTASDSSQDTNTPIPSERPSHPSADEQQEPSDTFNNGCPPSYLTAMKAVSLPCFHSHTVQRKNAWTPLRDDHRCMLDHNKYDAEYLVKNG
ncbi:uncharacterized protein ARMOST_07456 [Armillaria ostoyae]|uniref:Uncharacterized protein n=1 Tax=Armillaria ostoyae TaxID=47428 RepID=A0A284R5U5_ARMOS|nr:uncharacterized protein ARMOST_07456 [Armillaria ostoyae]